MQRRKVQVACFQFDRHVLPMHSSLGTPDLKPIAGLKVRKRNRRLSAGDTVGVIGENGGESTPTRSIYL